MSRGLRWIGAALVLFALLCAALFLFARQLLEAGASTALGRDVQIAGDLDIDYSLPLRIHAGRVTVSNPEWSQHPEMLTVQALTIAIDLPALLHGRLALPELRLQSPVLILEKTAQGPANWQFDGNGAQQKSAGSRRQWVPSIGHLSVNNGRISYYSAGERRAMNATVDTLEAEAASGSPATVSASGLFNGVAYTLEAGGAPIGALGNRAGGAHPFSLHIGTAVGDLQANGKVSAPLAGADISIHFTVKGGSLAALLPAGGGLAADQGYKLRGRFQGKAGTWTLADLEAESGQTLVRGSMALDTSATKPFLRADLNSPCVNLELIQGLVKAFNGSSEAGSGGAGLAPSQFDLVDARVSLSVDRIINAGLPLKNLLIEASLTNGKLTVDPFRVAIGNGRLLGSLAADLAAPTPGGQVSMQFDRVPVAPFLQFLPYDLEQKGRLDGRLALAFSSNTLGKAEGRLRYSEPASNTRLELDLARKQSSGQGWLVHLGASGTLRGARVDGEFTGRPLALVARTGTSPLALHLSVGDYRLQVEGQVAGAGTSLDLTVAASGPGTRKLSRLLGVDLPDLPSYAVSAKVNRTPDLLELTALKARVGKSRFTGKLALDRSGRRNLIRLDLEAGLLA
ncbi:MAG: AsmA family protein, partial [Burkholderiaceae bacterium]